MKKAFFVQKEISQKRKMKLNGFWKFIGQWGWLVFIIITGLSEYFLWANADLELTFFGRCITHVLAFPWIAIILAYLVHDFPLFRNTLLALTVAEAEVSLYFLFGLIFSALDGSLSLCEGITLACSSIITALPLCAAAFTHGYYSRLRILQAANSSSKGSKQIM